jgi:hypothetical protein
MAKPAAKALAGPRASKPVTVARSGAGKPTPR